MKSVFWDIVLQFRFLKVQFLMLREDQLANISSPEFFAHSQRYVLLPLRDGTARLRCIGSETREHSHFFFDEDSADHYMRI